MPPDCCCVPRNKKRMLAPSAMPIVLRRRSTLKRKDDGENEISLQRAKITLAPASLDFACMQVRSPRLTRRTTVNES